VVAKDAKRVTFDEWKAFWKCRHAYFKKWTGFQTKTSLAGSTCVALSRFTSTDSGTTVTDALSGLVWEKKTNDSTVHDKDNTYTWGTGASPYYGNGTAFSTFLTGVGTGLNVAGFAGAKDWRLPTLAELQTIMLDYTCTGAGGGATCVCTGPCVDSGFASLDPNTQSNFYWSATSYVPGPSFAWSVYFDNGYVGTYYGKTYNFYVRAVRGGW
jgi:hypothetical protein